MLMNSTWHNAALSLSETRLKKSCALFVSFHSFVCLLSWNPAALLRAALRGDPHGKKLSSSANRPMSGSSYSWETSLEMSVSLGQCLARGLVEDLK